MRHLVLPHRLAGTADIVRWLAAEVSTHTYADIMDQSHPCHRAAEFPELNRRITVAQCGEAVSLARQARLQRLDPHPTQPVWR